MGQRQGGGQPAAGENARPLPQHQQRRQHQKPGRGQEKAQRYAKRRRLFEGESGRGNHGPEIRISKLPSASAVVSYW